MELVIVDDYEALSRRGADWLMNAIQAKPDASRVVATGRGLERS